jgi:hypothetical protein
MTCIPIKTPGVCRFFSMNDVYLRQRRMERSACSQDFMNPGDERVQGGFKDRVHMIAADVKVVSLVGLPRSTVTRLDSGSRRSIAPMIAHI